MGKGGKRRANRRQAKGAVEKKPIGPASSYEGALGSQRNARRLFNDALLLHKDDRFRGAIPIAILSIEESLKGIELGMEFRKLRDIPASGQEGLTSHAHKFRHVHGWVVEHMEDGRMRDVYASLAREGRIPLEGGRPINLEDAIENSIYMRDMVSGLQHVKEMCMYEGWSAKRGSWEGLDIGDADAEALSVFVLVLAKAHYEMLHSSTDFALDTLVAKNPVFEKYREEKAELDAVDADPDKAQRGESILWGMYSRADVRRGATGRRAAG